MSYDFSESFGIDVDSRHAVLQSLTNFDPGLAGFEGIFEGSDMSMFCHSGDLEGIGAAAGDTRTVLTASLHPGSAMSQTVGNELMRKSLVLASLVAKRDRVAQTARGEIQKLLRAVRAGDSRTSLLSRKVLLADGRPRPGADPRDVDAFKKEHAYTKELGRRALRFQKVNALATVLRNNAAQQAALLQQIAVAQAVGQPNVVAALSASFNTLGRESDKVRNIRAAQIRNSVGSKGVLEGLSAFEGSAPKLLPGQAAKFAWDVACLTACPGPANPSPAQLSAWWERLGKDRRQSARQTFAVFESDPAVQGMTLAEKAAWWERLGKNGRVKRRDKFKDSFSVLDITDAIPGVKQVARTVNAGLKTVVKATGAVLNAACKLATSSVARAAISAGSKIAGPIVGGVVGGHIGTSVGGSAGSIAAQAGPDALDAGCKAVKGLGLTRGAFNVSGFATGIARGAKTFAKKNLRPEQLLAAAQSFGGAYLQGKGGSSALLNQYGGQAIQQLGLGGDAQQFLGQALKATQGGVTGSAAGQQLLQQFGGPVGNQLIAKLQGNILKNNAVAQAAGSALISQGGGASGSLSPFLQQALGF